MMQIDRSGFARLLRGCDDLVQGRRLEACLLAFEHHESDLFLRNLVVEMYGRCGSIEDAQRAFDSIQFPNVFSWNLLIGVYSRCGCIDQARKVFDALDDRRKNVITWNEMLTAYSRHGKIEEAKAIFKKMPQRDVVSWTALLTAVAANESYTEAKQVFEAMPLKTVVSWNAMLVAYLDSGKRREAKALFDSMPGRNSASWTAMLTAFAQNGYCFEARDLFDRMPERSVVAWSSIVIAFASVDDEYARRIFNEMPERDSACCAAMIAAYGSAGEIGEARSICLRIPAEPGALSVWTAMMVAYAQNGYLIEARQVFDALLEKDVVVWNGMIAGYVQNSQLEQAIHLFERVPELNTVTCNIMVKAFGDAGNLVRARDIFNNTVVKSLISWNVIIGAYARNRNTSQAFELFGLLDLEGVAPSSVTLIAVLDGCTDLKQGKEVVDECMKLLSSNVVLGNSLINFYSKCGSVEDARFVFDSMPEHTASSWNTMVAAYALGGHLNSARTLFQRMPRKTLSSWSTLRLLHALSVENVTEPSTAALAQDFEDSEFETTGVTISAMIDMCSSLNQLAEGRRIHFDIKRYGYTQTDDASVGNALINMYGKCGCLREATKVFETMMHRQLLTWNAMLTAHAQNGGSSHAMHLFQVMRIEGVEPDKATHSILLFSCSHVGVLTRTAGSDSSATCVAGAVDMLGRAGMLDEALLLTSAANQQDPDAWLALLSACRMHGDDRRGILAAKQFISLEPASSSPYILASNLSTLSTSNSTKIA